MRAAGGEILQRCKDLGFALAGVCEARPSDHARELHEWLAHGSHGSMEYLARHSELRLDISQFLEGARSVIMVADQYAQRPATGAAAESAPDDERFGRIARYAQGADYHKVMKKRLHTLCDALQAQHPDEHFRAFVDTAPVLEREHAARAGLGWIGKHSLLIHPRLGSWLFLGGVATTLDINPPAEHSAITDHCGACTRCIDACPTGAISPYSVNASKCIAYLTIERREEIEAESARKTDGWIFGCDVCQEVCPHNSPRDLDFDRGTQHDAYTSRHAGFDLLEVLGWSEDDRRRAFQTSALKRATLSMMKRNAILALANGAAVHDRAIRKRLEMITHDLNEPDLVRQTAQAALDRVSA